MGIKFLLFIAVISVFLLFSAGAAAADPGDSEDLVPILVNQDYINRYLDADNPSGFEDMDGYYVLEGNIDLKDLTWKPIGSEIAFSGTFDGAGCFIYDFKYDGDDQSSGFFTSSENASISNLTFINPIVTAADASGVGILIGTSKGTIIENCTVIGGSVRITGIEGENAGGFVGLFEGETSYIDKCDFKGSVENGGKTSGGLTGSAEKLIVTESSATWSIYAAAGYAGGLVGYVAEDGEVSVSDSYFEGDIRAEDQAGGLIGRVSLNAKTFVSDSYSVASILSENPAGLIGKTDNAEISVKDSFYFGEIEDHLDNGLGLPVTKEELMRYDTFTVLEDGDGIGYIQEAPWDIGPKSDILKIWYVAENEDYPRFSRNAPGGIDLPGIDIPRVDPPAAAEPARSGSTGSANVVESFSSGNEEVFKPPFALDLPMEPLSYKALYLILIVGFILIVAGVSRRLDRKD